VVIVAGDGTISTEATGLKAPARRVEFDEIWNAEYYEKPGRRRTTPAEEPSFLERDTGLAAEDAITEAGRCMRCGHCRNCGHCVEDCPGLILEKTDIGPVVTYPEECWHCGNCRTSCPDGAVSYEFPLYMFV